MTLTDREKDLVLSLSAPRIFEHIEKLCSFGPREDGSQADANAVAYVEGKLRGYGAHVVRVPSDIAISRERDVDLRIVSPQERHIECRVYGRSASTPEGGILTDKIVDAGHGIDEELLAKDVKDAIVLVVAGEVSPRLVAETAAQKGAVGCIFTRRRPDDLIATYGLDRYGSRIPVVGIGYRDGELLRSLLAEGSLTLVLNVQTGLGRGKVENIVGIVEGKERPGEILLLCAHRDSVPGSPGANDNASGMAVILEMMWAFSSQRLRRTLWGVLVGGGEGGSFGARDLVESRRAELGRIRAVINLDELGAGTVLHAVAAGESPPGKVWRTSGAVNRVLVGAAADLGYQLDDTFSGQMGGLADAQPFVEVGVPTAWISKGAGYAIKRYGHTPDDRPEKIEINALKIPADILAVSLLRLDGKNI